MMCFKTHSACVWCNSDAMPVSLFIHRKKIPIMGAKMLCIATCICVLALDTYIKGCVPPSEYLNDTMSLFWPNKTFEVSNFEYWAVCKQNCYPENSKLNKTHPTSIANYKTKSSGSKALSPAQFRVEAALVAQWDCWDHLTHWRHLTEGFSKNPAVYTIVHWQNIQPAAY